MDGRNDRMKSGWMDQWMDGMMDRWQWMDGMMDRWIDR